MGQMHLEEEEIFHHLFKLKLSPSTAPTTHTNTHSGKTRECAVNFWVR